jgi:hypothetical protein
MPNDYAKATGRVILAFCVPLVMQSILHVVLGRYGEAFGAEIHGRVACLIVFGGSFVSGLCFLIRLPVHPVVRGTLIVLYFVAMQHMMLVCAMLIAGAVFGECL